MGADFGMAWGVLETLIILGFTIGVVAAVVIGAARIGWQLAPWIFVGALLVWFLS